MLSIQSSQIGAWLWLCPKSPQDIYLRRWDLPNVWVFPAPGRSCMHAPLPSAGQTGCCQGWQRRQHLDHYSPVAPSIESIHSQIAPLPFFSSPFWGDSWEVATTGRLIIVSPGSLLVLLLLLCLKDVGFEEAYGTSDSIQEKQKRWLMREIGGALNFEAWIPWEFWHYQKAQLDDVWIP